MTNKLLQAFEAEQIKRELPDFGPGDTVVVNVKVKEGNRERVQAYEGVVIATKNAGLNSAFTVRKISHGFGVERVFQSHSAIIDSVEVKRVKDLSPRDIEHDNPEFRRTEEMVHFLEQIYGREVGLEDTVTVVRFSKIVENPPDLQDRLRGVGGAQN